MNLTTTTCSRRDARTATDLSSMLVNVLVYRMPVRRISCDTQVFLVFQKCVTALEKTWHTEHFFCAQCGQQFGEDGFHERDGKPYCRADYFDMFAPKCGGCNKPIMENYISALNTQWHPDCFVCKVSIRPYIPYLSQLPERHQCRFVYNDFLRPCQVKYTHELKVH